MRRRKRRTPGLESFEPRLIPGALGTPLIPAAEIQAAPLVIGRALSLSGQLQASATVQTLPGFGQVVDLGGRGRVNPIGQTDFRGQLVVSAAKGRITGSLVLSNPRGWVQIRFELQTDGEGAQFSETIPLNAAIERASGTFASLQGQGTLSLQLEGGPTVFSGEQNGLIPVAARTVRLNIQIQPNRS